MTDTSTEAVERHLDIGWNHEANLIPTATAILLAALLTERDALKAKLDVAVKADAIDRWIQTSASCSPPNMNGARYRLLH